MRCKLIHTVGRFTQPEMHDAQSEGVNVKAVYIASPYTIGDVAKNVRRQVDTATILIDCGMAPFWPLNSHFLHMFWPKSYETWVKLDEAWVKKCDALYRLEGESNGADREVLIAKENGIPVFYNLNDLYEWSKQDAD